MMSNHKDKYKTTNWSSYNASLCQRGSVNLLLSASLYSVWKEIDPSKKRVGEKMYPDVIIEICLTLGQVYHLPLRQTTGFIKSLFTLMSLDLSIPDYTTLCRRKGNLNVKVSHRTSQQSIDIVVDSTGLKVYGEGEWKVRKHGVSKRRTWQKLHLGIDGCTQEVVSVVLTNNSVADAHVVEDLFKGCAKKVKSFCGDGTYDTDKVRKILSNGKIKQKIPPQRNAVLSKKKEKHLVQRDQAINRIKGIGRKEWKKEIEYHQRSLNETAMFRYKTSIGASLKARKMDKQINEVKIGCHILNVFRSCGMPNSVKFA